MSDTSSIQLWSRSFNYANLLLLFAIILTLIATYWIYISASNVDKFKDAELARERHADAAKIATANAEAARANEGVAKANVKVADASAQIAAANMQITGAKKDAAEAYKQGQLAVVSAEEAKLKQEELRKENIQLNTRLNESIVEAHNTKIALTVAQQNLAEAQQKQAEAQFALQQTVDRVKKDQQPRTMTDHQKIQFINLLKTAPPGKVTIFCVLGNAESKAYAMQINDALISSGWITDGINQGDFGNKDPEGILLLVHSPETIPPYANTLLNALNSTGLLTQGVQDPSIPENSIQLTVGIKPVIPVK